MIPGNQFGSGKDQWFHHFIPLFYDLMFFLKSIALTQVFCFKIYYYQVIINKEQLSLPHTKVKLDSLQEAKPDAVIVICPYCMAQLDRMQQKLNYRKISNYNVPVIHITQLVAMALGVDIKKLGFGAHAISFKKFLEKFYSIENLREVENG